MDMIALLETLLTCITVPLFVIGMLALLAVILLVLDKKILQR